MAKSANPSVCTCPFCGLLQHIEAMPPDSIAQCQQCGSVVARHKSHTLARTAAFSLAALVLYIPANIYPILRMQFHGVFTESTVWDGCVRLYRDGQWFIATIVFLASLLIPVLKLLGLFFLVLTTRFRWSPARVFRLKLHRLIEMLGPWAMLDVFLLAILVGLVKLGRVATVTAGPGLLAFGAVVVLTSLASASFEPREIWEGVDEVED